ncbi:LysR family transcriptional regulator [Rugamonas sp.]|uniref:LysR family transcriptional regulator n=1 Tax=Rugamonas sp. TaxID=1926287 RepID=UPI0025DF7D8D|nr:LysR family transcriptional regulator [Rugamonas sp.]
MDNLGGIGIFVKVADTRNFTLAGRALGVSSSAIGKSISRMEERLKVRLFHRSTRSVTLTAEGALFLERCKRILGEIDAAEVELSEYSGSPAGRLRVSMPQLSGMLMPALNRFMKQYPEIQLDIDLSDRVVDIVEEGYDAVIRAGLPRDSRLVFRRLGTCDYVLVASPGYLKRRGTPKRPADLSGHACLRYKFKTSGRIEPWPMRREPGESEPAFYEGMIANNVETIMNSALAGLGIAMLPRFVLQDQLERGLLLPVLEGMLENELTFVMLWPANKHNSPKLRVFIDFLARHLFAPAP